MRGPITGVEISTPQPFEVAVPQERVDEMVRRIRATAWPDDHANADWAYGVERSWLRELTEYWGGDYDWRRQEAAINELPQHTCVIDGLTVHYVHLRGSGVRNIPLILSHGWPWTFWDWHRVARALNAPLANGRQPEIGFDLVIPSLPGYAFSSPLRATGVGARRVAKVWDALMRDVLGYEQYGAAGGDFGSTVTAELGHGYGESLLGVWLTLPSLPGVAAFAFTADDYAEDEQWMWDRTLEVRPTIAAHTAVNRNEPQTIAYALADSPVGTAAWILGRRHTWGDFGDDFHAVFDRDFLCTTASIYWLTGTTSTSMRIYHDQYVGGVAPAPLHDREQVIDVPTAFAIFPKELLLLPKAVAEKRTNLARWSLMPVGGHFAPYEQPQLVADDIRAHFESVSAGAA